MSPQSKVITGKGFRFFGTVVFLLGLIHLLYTSDVAGLLKETNSFIRISFLYFYVATGVSLLFCGFLLILIANQIKQNHNLSILLPGSLAVYLGILGVGAVLAMPNNPFAYLMLVIAIGFGILVVRNREIFN